MDQWFLKNKDKGEVRVDPLVFLAHVLFRWNLFGLWIPVSWLYGASLDRQNIAEVSKFTRLQG